MTTHLAGRYLCSECKSRHELVSEADSCCATAKAIEADPDLDPTDKREARLMSELDEVKAERNLFRNASQENALTIHGLCADLEQARRRDEEGNAIIAKLNETVGAMDARLESNRIDGALREASMLARATRAEAALGKVSALVGRQAADYGLWFHAQTAPEAYLQVHLRELHRVVEMAKWTAPSSPTPGRGGSR